MGINTLKDYVYTKLPSKPWHLSRGVDFNLENWRLKRSLTTKIFVLECVMLGMEYSVTFLTLWLYLNTLVKTDYPKVFYSLVSSAYLLACVIFSVVIGRYVDRSRKVRLTFITCNTLVIIGNIIYALHFSPWLLVIGRLISGTDGPLRSVISGEVARSYPNSEILGKFSIMGMAFSVGFIMGPGVNFIFTGVDFWIGTWHITYVNVPGLYMAFFFIITQIIVIFGLSDLSREFDLKRDSVDGKFRQSSVKVAHFEIEKSNVPKKYRTGSVFENSIQPIDENTPFMKLTGSNAFYENSFQQSTNVMENSIEGSIAASFNRNKTSVSESSIKTKPIGPNWFQENSFQQSIMDSSIEGSMATSFNRNKTSFSESSIKTKTIENSTQRRKKALAYEKLEQSSLFSQSFGVSDFFVTASMLHLLRKEQQENSEDTDNEKMYEYDDDVIPTMWSVLYQIVTNIDAMIVLFLTLTLWYWMVAFDMWLPILVVDVLKFGITELNGIVFGFGIFSAVILFIISTQTFTDSTLFTFAMISMVALACMEGIFIVFKLIPVPIAVNAMLWIIWGTLFALVVVMDEVFLVGVLAKMVNSNIQTFTESIRLAMSRLGALFALLTSALLFDWLEYVCTAAIVFALLALLLLLWRRKTLRAPSLCIR